MNPECLAFEKNISVSNVLLLSYLLLNKKNPKKTKTKKQNKTKQN